MAVTREGEDTPPVPTRHRGTAELSPQGEICETFRDLGFGMELERSQGCDYAHYGMWDVGDVGSSPTGARLGIAPGREGTRRGHGGSPAHHDAGPVVRQGVDGQAAAHQVLADPSPLGRVPSPPSIAPGGAPWGGVGGTQGGVSGVGTALGSLLCPPPAL